MMIEDDSPQRDKYKALDTLNLGVFLFMLCTGSKPFMKTSEQDELYKTITTDPEKFCSVHPVLEQILKAELISEKLLDLIMKLLTSQPNEHLSMKEVKEHPWMLSTDLPYKLFVQTTLDSLEQNV